MRLGRIASPDGVAFVSIEGDPGSEIVREIAEHPFGTPTFTGRSWPLADVRLLAPILASKVVCMGKNYAAHIEEMGGEAPEDPVIFLKPNTSIIGPAYQFNCPPTLHRCTTRVSSRRDRPALQGRPGRPCRGEHPGLHDRQRRVRPRSAEGRRTVDARQGGTTRSVPPARGSSPISIPPIWRSAPRSTARCAS